MEVVIDTRERALSDALNSANVSHSVSQMPIGDASISSDGEIRVIVERKTWADLASSIRDGRYRDQQERISSVVSDPRRVVYIIEGDVDRDYVPRHGKNPVSRDALRSAVVRLGCDRGYTVLFARNVTDTAAWIESIRRKLPDFGRPDSGYSGCAAVSKAQRATPSDVYRLMLRQIPCIGPGTSDAIAAEFPTFRNLIDALESDPDRIASLKVKGRSLSKTSFQSLISFLMVN